jgi:hypothetical protein
MEQKMQLHKAMQEMLQEVKDDIGTNREEVKTNQAKVDAN